MSSDYWAATGLSAYGVLALWPKDRGPTGTTPAASTCGVLVLNTGPLSKFAVVSLGQKGLNRTL